MNTDFIEYVRQKLGNAPSPESVIPGKLTRFATDGRRDDKAGWLKLFLDGQGGVFGDWRQGISESWQAHEPRASEEREQFRRRIEQAQAEEKEERKAEHAKARAAIDALWKNATGANPTHAYLLAKNVKAHGIRQSEDSLLIPVRDAEGNLHCLQSIGPDGKKQFQKGSQVAGNFLLLGEPKDKLLIAEGYATGATIHEITGRAVAVAFNVGNLKPVAEALRSKYLDVIFVICADDDYQTEGNPGLTKATEAARAVNGLLAVPAFPDNRGSKDTDFNDLSRLAGLKAVEACIEAAAIHYSQAESVSTINRLDAAVARLAALSLLQYDQARKTEAKALGIRVAILDAAVKVAREGTIADNLPFTDVDPWPEPVDPAKLLTDIATTIRRFIVCNEEVSHTVVLWVAMTWFINVVQIAPLAVITSPEKRCGKSLLLSLLGRLSARAITASSISPAALFRTIEAWNPTLLIDEADSFIKDNEELRGLLNSGHTRDSAYVIRTVGDNFTPTKFSTWGAKALAGIGHVADTLMDRAVILELRRKLAHEEVERIRYAKPGLFDELRSKLARFAEDYSEKVRQVRPPLPHSLNDRAQDNWEPLLAIAMTAGNEWLQIGTTAALKVSGGESASQTIGAELLSDIQEIFEGKQVDRITTEELLKALCADDEKPWATYSRGLKITPRQLANKLKAYGIHSKTIRIGFDTAKGYVREQLNDAFIRYAAPSPENISHTSQTATSAALAVTDSPARCGYETGRVTRKLTPVEECDVVTDRNPLPNENIFDLSEADLDEVRLL